MATLESINTDIPLDPLTKLEEVVSVRNSIVDCSEEIFPTNIKREFIREGPLSITKINNPDKKKKLPPRKYTLSCLMIIY